MELLERLVRKGFLAFPAALFNTCRYFQQPMANGIARKYGLFSALVLDPTKPLPIDFVRSFFALKKLDLADRSNYLQCRLPITALMGGTLRELTLTSARAFKLFAGRFDNALVANTFAPLRALRVLTLTGSDFAPFVLAGLTCLETLKLVECILTDRSRAGEGWRAVAPTLRELKYSSYWEDGKPESLPIGTFTNLQRLSLEQGISHPIPPSFPLEMRKLTGLRDLRLARNISDAADQVLDALPQLERLHLSACHVTGAFFKSLTNVHTLRLSVCSSGMEWDEMPARLPRLRCLKLFSNSALLIRRDWILAHAEQLTRVVDNRNNVVTWPLVRELRALRHLTIVRTTEDCLPAPDPATLRALAARIDHLELRGHALSLFGRPQAETIFKIAIGGGRPLPIIILGEETITPSPASTF